MLRKIVRKVIPLSVRKKLKGSVKSASTPSDTSKVGLTPYRCQHNYTIVSAVYNMEKYLDDYFTSIFSQTCDTSCIKIILVDDGSTDSSPSIIRHWQDAYPEQITYFCQENAGPGAARNRGLQEVETEWVTFIDSDDKVAADYFEQVDKSLCAHPSAVLVTCKLIYWHMADDTFDDNNIMARHFTDKEQYFAVGDEQMHPIFFMNASFLKTDIIRAKNLAIDPELRPIFEDGQFLSEYLLSAETGLVGYLSKPRYLYRKRDDQSSLIDKSWSDPRRYHLVPERGYIDLLKHAKEIRGYVPLNIQQMILQELSWYFKRLDNHPERNQEIGTAKEQEGFISIIQNILSYISLEELFRIKGSFMPYMVKRGVAERFMGKEPPYLLCKLIRTNSKANRLLLETYSDKIEFFLDGSPIESLDSKRVDVLFCGQPLFQRYEIWLPLTNNCQIFSYRLPGGKLVKLDVAGKTFDRSVSVKVMIDRHRKNWDKYPQQGDTWIVMDRDTQADDNGEHFYRYLMKHHPEQRALFALRSSSPDWQRLQQEGFQLIDFGTPAYEKELKACSKIISSHADNYVQSYFDDSFHHSKDFIFLQHGIIKDDLSTWLNSFSPTLMLTTTQDELNSIVADGSPYLYTKSQVALTGLPRHDSLLRKRKEHQMSHSARKTILVMPTWRRYLSGGQTGKGNQLALKPGFEDSEFATAWERVLSSPKLRQLADEHCATIVFFPHANILPYITSGHFRVPDYVEVGSCDQKSIQDYFAETVLCITDYSSASFDASLARIPVVYYQFDQDMFYSGEHGATLGYFDFQADGFGPVAQDAEDCLEIISRLADNDFELEKKYLKRIEGTFEFADGKCCERVFDRIQNLD